MLQSGDTQGSVWTAWPDPSRIWRNHLSSLAQAWPGLGASGRGTVFGCIEILGRLRNALGVCSAVCLLWVMSFSAWRQILGLSLLLVILGSLGLKAAGNWLRMENEYVVIVSDASEKDMAEFAVAYSAFRKSFEQWIAPVDRKLPAASILLFRQKNTFRKYAATGRNDHEEWLIRTTEIDGRTLTALGLAGNRQEMISALYESETTFGIQRVGFFLPIWMTQGAGEVFASLDIRKSQCILGEEQNRFAEVEENSWLPWDEFFAVRPESAIYKDETKGTLFRAQAWAVMHRLLLEPNTDCRQRLTALAAGLREGKRPEQMLEEITGAPLDRLEKQFFRNLKEGMRRTLLFDEAELRRGLKAVPAGDAEVKVWLAELLTASGRQPEADLELEGAQKKSPENVLVKEARARREVRRGDTAAAAALYREAISAGTRNSYAFLISANARLDEVSVAGTDYAGQGGGAAETAIEEIRRALTIDAGNIDAYRLLGRAFYVAPNVAAENLAELMPGIAATDGGLWVRYYRALLFQRLGRLNDGLEDLMSIVKEAGAPEFLRQMAVEQMQQARLLADGAAIEGLLAEKKFAEARARVAAAMEDQGQTVATRRRYQEIRVRIHEAEALDQLTHLYESRRWAELEEAAQVFLQNFPRSSANPNVHKLLDISKRGVGGR
jgi:hypothetical protein